MINQNRLIETFLNLVKIDSPTGREKEVGDFILKIIKEIDLKEERDRVGNIIVRLPGEGEPLFFNAHLDTVQPGEGINYKIKKGTIISDGTTILGADNKVAVAAIIEALRWLKKNGRRALEVVFTVSEESENLGAFNLDYSSLRSKFGFCFDCGEKLGTVILGSPFYDSFDVLIKGKSAHAASPEKGINALGRACQSLGRLKTGRVGRETVLNVGTIQGGSARNAVPGKVNLSGEIRSFEEKDIIKWEDKINKVFMNDRVTIKRENNGYDFQKTDTWVKNTTKILRELNLKVYYKKSWACSDANIFNKKGLKVLNLGEGAKNIHTCQENIKIKDMVILTQLIIKLADDFSCD